MIKWILLTFIGILTIKVTVSQANATVNPIATNNTNSTQTSNSNVTQNATSNNNCTCYLVNYQGISIQ